MACRVCARARAQHQQHGRQRDHAGCRGHCMNGGRAHTHIDLLIASLPALSLTHARSLPAPSCASLLWGHQLDLATHLANSTAHKVLQRCPQGSSMWPTRAITASSTLMPVDTYWGSWAGQATVRYAVHKHVQLIAFDPQLCIFAYGTDWPNPFCWTLYVAGCGGKSEREMGGKE